MGDEPGRSPAGHDVQAWIDAGLYDPTRAGAEDRLALLWWLDEQGITLEEMLRADGEGRLFAVVGDRIVRGNGPRLTSEACAEMVGLSHERFLALWRALGFADPDPGSPLLTASEAEAFEIVGLASDILGREAGDRLASTISQSVRMIAEAVNVAFIEADETTMLDRSGSELTTAQIDATFDSMIPAFHRWLNVLHALHHESSNRHLELAFGIADDSETVRTAVGFADVCGYTSLSNRLDRSELAVIVAEFRQWAAEQVRRTGARLVKSLGDGVMFVGSVDAVVSAALGMVQAGTAPAGLRLHAGVAYGDVLPSGGDYFGPIVNLAARLCDEASEGVVLADSTTAHVWQSHGTAIQHGRRSVKGIDHPVAVWAVGTAGGH